MVVYKCCFSRCKLFGVILYMGKYYCKLHHKQKKKEVRETTPLNYFI